MSEDAKWIVDLFKMQLGCLKNQLMDGKLTYDRFDELSYESWAIEETLLAINDYQGYVSVKLIREILRLQLHDYQFYGSSNKPAHRKFNFAAEMIKELLDLTRGYVSDYEVY